PGPHLALHAPRAPGARRRLVGIPDRCHAVGLELERQALLATVAQPALELLRSRAAAHDAVERDQPLAEGVDAPEGEGRAGRASLRLGAAVRARPQHLVG